MIADKEVTIIIRLASMLVCAVTTYSQGRDNQAGASSQFGFLSKMTRCPVSKAKSLYAPEPLTRLLSRATSCELK